MTPFETVPRSRALGALTRRRFLRLAAITLAGSAAAAAGGAGWAWWIEPNRLVLERVDVPIANLPAAFDGFRIALLSDFHLYPYTTLPHIREATRMALELDADVVALTGDYVLENAESVFDLAMELATLNARHGVFAVLGNHDYWTNAAVVRVGLDQAGVTLLDNRAMDLTVGSERLVLAGVDDYWSGRPNLPGALKSVPADVPVILSLPRAGSHRRIWSRRAGGAATVRPQPRRPGTSAGHWRTAPTNLRSEVRRRLATRGHRLGVHQSRRGRYRAAGTLRLPARGDRDHAGKRLSSQLTALRQPSGSPECQPTAF